MVGGHWKGLERMVDRSLTDLEESVVRAGREMRTVFWKLKERRGLFCNG